MIHYADQSITLVRGTVASRIDRDRRKNPSQNEKIEERRSVSIDVL